MGKAGIGLCLFLLNSYVNIALFSKKNCNKYIENIRKNTKTQLKNVKILLGFLKMYGFIITIYQL